VIGSLRGVVLERTARNAQSGEVLVEVGGVGYRAVVPAGSLPHIPQPGEPVFLHVHTHVREDAIILYGFPARDERACFEMLIGAHGVGPAVALGLLSVHSPAALRRAVAHEDSDALMLVPGIGKKTAVRLLMELKSRFEAEIEAPDLQAVAPVNGPGGPIDLDSTDSDPAAVRQEVRAALAGLGYAADEIRQALTRLPQDVTVEEAIRFALRDMAVAR
jgi:Holliday junction DNA helicase RuvA